MTDWANTTETETGWQEDQELIGNSFMINEPGLTINKVYKGINYYIFTNRSTAFTEVARNETGWATV